MKFTLLSFLTLITLSAFSQSAHQATITINTSQHTGEISPLQYGQFIEHLGRAVNGGIYDAHSPLSDLQGFRTDVLDKVKELNIPLLRYPGGTFVKTYHWEDGVGPLADRKKRRNLIWGGVEDNHFGTAEFIAYCRKIGAEPFLVVNMATGTPEEAANWVEYCNGTGDTHYANMRRKDGFTEPFNVKYWGIGNEEYAGTDMGKDQEVNQYIKDTWMFVKMMKLQDNDLKLILVGNSEDLAWSAKVLEELGPVCDFLAIHLYSIPPDGTFQSLIHSIDQFEKPLVEMEALLRKQPEKVAGFNHWYRFPPRKEAIKLAVDEWGIWDLKSKKGKGVYQMEYQYNWSHALGVATFLNLFQRHSGSVGMATWAQTVNVLAPIMTDSAGSYRQTIFTALKAYRDFAGKYTLHADVNSAVTEDGIQALDIAASETATGDGVVLMIVNRDAAHKIKTTVKLDQLPAKSRNSAFRMITYTGRSLDAVNSFQKEDAVIKRETTGKLRSGEIELDIPTASITIFILGQ